MMIRERQGKLKKTVFMTRIVYSPDKKRGEQIALGSFPSDADEVPDEFLNGQSQLTQPEKYEIMGWLRDKQADANRDHKLQLGPDVIKSMRAFADALNHREFHDALLNFRPAEFFSAYDEVVKALKAHKIARPKDKALSKPKVAVVEQEDDKGPPLL